MAGYSPKKDRFYLLSTVEMNDTEKKTAYNRDYGIYEFDFFNQRFTRLGEIKLPLVLNFLDSKETKPFVFNGRYFIISDKPNRSLPTTPSYLLMWMTTLRCISGKILTEFT